MGIVSKVTKRVDVPNDPGQWLELRQLSYLTLNEARAKQTNAMAQAAASFAAISKALADLSPEQIASARAKAEADPLSPYDTGTLLRHGIAAWSYEGPVDHTQLDDATAPWAARQILDYTFPTAADQKKDSSPSTGS